MKKALYIMLVVILTILLFGGFIYLIYSYQERDYNNFKNEVIMLVEQNELKEHDVEKIYYKMYEYAKSDFSTVEGFKVYTLKGFERYIKQNDFDFWYELKTIFEE